MNKPSPVQFSGLGKANLPWRATLVSELPGYKDAELPQQGRRVLSDAKKDKYFILCGKKAGGLLDGRTWTESAPKRKEP